MALRIDINKIQDFHEKKIFLDTNIWIYLFCPLGNSRSSVVNEYSRAYSYLIQSDNTLYTDIAVLSEFINRYLKLAYHVYMANNNIRKKFDYKRDYKKTDDFKETVQLVFSTIKNKILSRVSVANLNYDNKDMEEIICNLKDRMIDFNDLHIEKLCKKNGFILLTNDGDYANSVLDIISGNPRLLDIKRKGKQFPPIGEHKHVDKYENRG